MQQYTLMMVLFLALLLCDLLCYSDAIRCYICGPSPHDLLENLNNTITSSNCTDLDHLWNLRKEDLARETFVKECPEDSPSCLLQKDANRKLTIRSCEKFELNDCQKANNITYCYCTKDYCNHENVPNQPQIITSKDRRHHSISDEINDDEDLNDEEEASGSKEHIHRDNSALSNKSSDRKKIKNTNSAAMSSFNLTEIFMGFSFYIEIIVINQILRFS